MWGVVPIYFKQISYVPAKEILMHRVIWSAILLTVLVLVFKQIPKVRTVLRSPKLIMILLLASALLAGNWLLFIWAVNANHMLDASLGYYINPLLNVLLGRVFFQERLRPLQKFAVALASIGVLVLVVAHGQVPWIALLLAGSFGIYGVFRKKIPVDAVPGLFLETIALVPLAIAFWILYPTTASNMFSNDMQTNLWLIASGIVTALPLLCFTGAAKRIMYSTLGFFQYIGPTLMFFLAVWLYNEPLHDARLLTFSIVWVALLLFSGDSLRVYNQQRKARKLAVLTPKT